MSLSASCGRAVQGLRVDLSAWPALQKGWQTASGACSMPIWFREDEEAGQCSLSTTIIIAKCRNLEILLLRIKGFSSLERIDFLPGKMLLS